jgi:hypothetical protein
MVPRHGRARGRLVLSRIPHQRELNDEHYVDDHALAQIPPALPLLGLGRDEQMLIRALGVGGAEPTRPRRDRRPVSRSPTHLHPSGQGQVAPPLLGSE